MSQFNMIDLYSDTLTKPTAAMRRAMMDAPVADEQRREDPTTNALQEKVAAHLGKEAAVFLPSGSMCNAIAVKTHTQPSDAILCDRFAHVYRSEFGGAGVLSGVTTEPIDGDRGRFTAEQLAEALGRFSAYGPVPRLVCVEQTHNYGGGTIWPLDQLRAVCDLAHQRGLSTHMDGARLLNASVASGINPAGFAAGCDSVWIDLSKGLGCPIGAVLAGTKQFIEKAWRWKHLFGGAMRQSGILAAAGLYALEHHVDRLADDHANAKLLAKGLSHIKGIDLQTPEPQTNIVFFRITGERIANSDFVKRALERGVRFSGLATGIRAVTHLDITTEDIRNTLGIVESILA
jgi:threonine aldolase